MLIETTSLPIHIQEQIIAHQQNDVLNIAKSNALSNHGVVKDSLMATAGLWAKYNIDGVEYQNEIRSEWEREWEKEGVEISQ